MPAAIVRFAFLLLAMKQTWLKYIAICSFWVSSKEASIYEVMDFITVSRVWMQFIVVPTARELTRYVHHIFVRYKDYKSNFYYFFWKVINGHWVVCGSKSFTSYTKTFPGGDIHEAGFVAIAKIIAESNNKLSKWKTEIGSNRENSELEKGWPLLVKVFMYFNLSNWLIMWFMEVLYYLSYLIFFVYQRVF